MANGRAQKKPMRFFASAIGSYRWGPAYRWGLAPVIGGVLVGTSITYPHGMK